MKKEKAGNQFIWSGLFGGIGTLIVFFLGGSLPVAVISGAAIFAVSSLLFRRPHREVIGVMSSEDGPSLLETGCAEAKIMHKLADAMDDKQIMANAQEVCRLCDKIISIVSEDEMKLSKSTKLFTYYIPTINKALSIYQKLEDADTDRTVYDKAMKFLDDCKEGLQKHIVNLSRNDIIDLSVEMETMTTIMSIDGLVENSDNQLKLHMQTGGQR